MEWLHTMIWGIQVWEMLALLGIGMFAGTVGGMLGIGGGVINIPAITLLLARSVHMAQAASMVVTLFVAVPAAIRHRRMGALRMDALVRIVPPAILGILGGVTLSIWISNKVLMVIFGVFLIFVMLDNARRLTPRSDADDDTAADVPVTLGRAAFTGICAGFGAGLLGIGGGLITVPVVQAVCRLTLRQAIATSAAVMCMTAPLGTAWKLVTLHEVPGIGLDVHWYTPLPIAMCLIPTCLIGSWVGARLTHVMPLRIVRGAFMVVVAIGALRMLS